MDDVDINSDIKKTINQTVLKLSIDNYNQATDANLKIARNYEGYIRICLVWLKTLMTPFVFTGSYSLSLMEHSKGW